MQPSTSNPASQQVQPSSSSSAGRQAFLVVSSADPAFVSSDVVMSEPKKRTRHRGQNKKDSKAAQYPAYVGTTSYLASGYSEDCEIPQRCDASRCDFAIDKRSEDSEVLSSCDAFAFHDETPYQACEKGTAFHVETPTPPTICMLDLGCTRVMGSRRAVDAFCRRADSHPESGLWYEQKPTSPRFFCANSQQFKCSEKLVVFMCDYAWNIQNTECDIVEEGDVPLLMSLPQMGNLGFQFKLSPDNAFLSCNHAGMRKEAEAWEDDFQERHIIW